ncbi:hypothetical protein OSH08_21630 [Kaistia geumhonensis]|uniref:Tetratricopeptide (TPR) repeat protein n=1 Tax=Kaistia geumhonensis TaxID=410839 RepID=A0ABU0MCI1_9HYPH|nr:hypothetical protein [Kaistia geumhonensis]MCX5481614.1 hypothetical protein [Kaistia geumhonensis]MDQ0518681.1 tetratricopeptide (TPR) repeat protein [Kaistia geumhonensis]
MPVRGIFLVIGSVAIVGILGAVFVRQAATRTDDLSQVMRPGGASSSAATAGMFLQTADAASAVPVADDVFGANRMAQAQQVQVAPPVVLPGAQAPAGAGGVQLPGTNTIVRPGATAPAAPTAPAAAAPVQAPAVQPAPVAPATTQPVQPQQAQGTSEAPQSGNAAAPASGVPAVDETALRYFARQGDTRRLNAEIARLRALYPTWYPPADMTAPIPVVDALLDNMWQLYSQGNYAAVRAAIADRVATQPGWTPPADLLARLDVGEQRERLVNASNAKQWETVVQIAAATPSLLTCADVDVLWRLAEAFARSDRPGRARDVDVYVLTNCQDPKERLATVQKAMAYLGDAELADLLALERVGADGKGEFAPVKGDIARRRVGSAAKDAARTAPPEDLTLLGELAKASNKPDDAVLLASYLFTHNDAESSAMWWALAKTRADTPQIARGLAYALNALERPAEAEAAAYRWRDASPENKEAYLVVATALLALDPPAKIEPDVMARMAKVIGDAKYAPGAQDLGWYAYNTGQTVAAARWFSAALTWKPDLEPAAFGLALAAQKLGDRAALAQILKVWGPRSQRIADLADPVRQRAAAQKAQRGFDLPPSIAAPGSQPLPARGSDLAPATTPATTTAYVVPDPGGNYVEPVSAAEPAVAPVRRVASSSGGGGGGSDCRRFVPPGDLRGQAALNRGWCLMGYNRPIEAADAFDAAMRTTSGKSRQDAAYGKSLAALRAGLTDTAAISAASAPQSPKRAEELNREILTQRALAAYSDNRWTEALMFLDQRSQLAPEQKDLLMIRAWSYFHLGRVREAKRILTAVAGTGSREAAKALVSMTDANKPMYDADDIDRR